MSFRTKALASRQEAITVWPLLIIAVLGAIIGAELSGMYWDRRHVTDQKTIEALRAVLKAEDSKPWVPCNKSDSLDLGPSAEDTLRTILEVR